jgi:hypothetical protein
MMFMSHRKHAYKPPWPVTGIALLFLYVDDVHTSQEAHLWTSAACYVYVGIVLLVICR